MDFLGFFKSPDNPTPAVMPVNAGKIMANTIKKLSGFSTFDNRLNEADSGVGDLPRKNMTRDIPKILATIHNTFTPMCAPLVSMMIIRMHVAGMPIIQI